MNTTREEKLTAMLDAFLKNEVEDAINGTDFDIAVINSINALIERFKQHD